MYSLRPYQQAAVDAVYRHLRERDTNPCVVIPTAGGKSLCLAQVAKDTARKWGGRVMILAHVKELVEQNAEKIRSICPDLDVGVYSAGLNSRDTEQPVIVAGIQSVSNRIDLFRPFDIVMVDECHLIPTDGEGRYRTFLSALKERNPNVRLVGWTATPFRTKGGLICKPDNLLQEVCYEIGVKDLIDQGYISKLVSKAGRAKPDLGGLHIRGGEFVAEDVELVMSDERIVRSACREIVDRTKDRKACLIFCTSVKHCRAVAKLITKFSGEECAIVTGDTPADVRSQMIARLRGERVPINLFGGVAPPLRYCCNVSVLTTGTDIPNLDSIALLRPTNSPGLLIQMIGRGFRLSPKTGKTDCLVLDYGRNIERFGPIDMIEVSDSPGGGERKVNAKECPECQTLVRLNLMRCPECGYEFEPQERKSKQDATASELQVVSDGVRQDSYEVQHVEMCVWEKRGAPPGSPKTVRVTYFLALNHSVSEWLCPEHTGYARRKFEKWWRENAAPECPMPVTAEEVCEHKFCGMLRVVRRIKVRQVEGAKYPEIVHRELGDLEINEKHKGEDPESCDCDDLPF